MPQILVYTFFSYTKKTSKGLYELNNSNIDKLFIPNRFATDKLLSVISKYNFVIGIADHNKNASKSRIDPTYINQYGRNEIKINDPKYLKSNLNIGLSDNFYVFDSTTNGPCNRSAYLVMDTIIENKLKTKFSFFHLKGDECLEDLGEILDSISLTF